MKKRSMLAIASLATGFVVAAVTPSHAGGDIGLSNLDLDPVSTLDDSLSGAGQAGAKDTPQGKKAQGQKN
ncbi:hypothetical protein ADL00_08900 [Streptomyces sp. AS58]|uniref:Secreted protein n=1 Tax=Streptomyces cadmiisoli TaxID=2184053 RepID=A0A2Z4J6Z0_9ACTN|nr:MULTISPECIES: hypothetical protein [Streptomyces]AWW41005.1 hypothetical protein DN051_33600 [Streptomyces cadmiisoli]KOV70349.1 hypothetical protein ADL00_08900 [Streptomyces sp. AS58]